MTSRKQKSAFLSSCSAHIVQDGLGALPFVLLPILATTLGLSYTQVGLLKSIKSLAMSMLEIPSAFLAEKFGERRLLIMGLIAGGAGYCGIAVSNSFSWAVLFFAIVGAGAAFQHSLSCALLVNNFHAASRKRVLGTYNAAGDAGKLLYTTLFSAAVGAGIAWNYALIALAFSALLLAIGIRFILRPENTQQNLTNSAQSNKSIGWGILQPSHFSLLCLAVFLDSMVQTVFLTFLAFILIDNGYHSSAAAAGVTLALAGGMVGKFACGYLATLLGDRLVFSIMQLSTIVGLLLVVYLPASLLLLLLPFIGLAVQGSTTMTYGAVADYLHPSRQSRGYSLIYALSALAAVAGPPAFGWIADKQGLTIAVQALICITAFTIPLCPVLPGKQAMGKPTKEDH